MWRTLPQLSPSCLPAPHQTPHAQNSPFQLFGREQVVTAASLNINLGSVTSWATLNKALNFLETFRIFRIVEVTAHESNRYISLQIIGPLSCECTCHKLLPFAKAAERARAKRKGDAKGQTWRGDKRWQQVTGR